MRSAGYLIKAIMYRFTLLVFVISLTACGSDNPRALPETVTDTTPPSIVRTTPDADDTDHEIDTLPSILFSELINLESLSGSIKLFSGAESDSEETKADSLVERPIEYEVLTVLGEELQINPLTGQEYQVDATLVNLIPQGGRLSLRTPYIISIDPVVHDLVEDNINTSEDERNFMSGEVIPFVTESGVWVDPQVVPLRYLSDDGLSSVAHDSYSYSPNFSSTSSGDVILVWRQVVDGRSQIWASRYLVNDQTWVLPSRTSASRHCRLNPTSSDPACANSVRVDSADSDAYSPSVDISQNGSFAIAWSQAVAGSDDTSIWVNLFEDGSWSGASFVSTNHLSNEVASEPQVRFLSNDDAMVVWYESLGAIKRLRSTMFKFSSAFTLQNFSVPIYIDSSTLALGDASKLDFASSGSTTTLAWVQILDGVSRIRSNRIVTNGAGDPFWVGVEELDIVSGVGHASDTPKVAMSPSGAVTVVWRQAQSSRFDLWHSRLVGRAWSTPSKLEIDDRGNVTDVTLTYDGHNKLFVAWTLQVGAGDEIWRRNFHADTGWSLAEDVDVGGGFSSTAQVGGLTFSSFDLERNGSLMWIEGGATSVVKVVDYTHFSRLWSSPVSLNSGLGGRIVDLNKDTLMQDGRMLAVWIKEANAQSSINASVFMESIASID